MDEKFSMRIGLIVLLCSLSINASAQWWRLKKREPLPLLEQVAFQPAPVVYTATIPHPRLASIILRSAYSLEQEEALVMKQAQHNMRFRMYDMASYKFSDLAQLYVKQNRYSEAKWYFLQSSYLSRQQNNDRLTISNLSKLAMVKLEIGDFVLACDDLREARDIAASRGWLLELIAAEKQLDQIAHTRIAALRNNYRYAELTAEN